MDSLWDTLPAAVPQSANPALPPPPPPDEFSPAALVEADLNKQQNITSMFPKLSQICAWGDELCNAAWELSNFVPPNIEEYADRKKLWSGLLIPKMVQSITDDIRTRNLMERSFAAISALAISINEGATLIRNTRGNKHSIEVARESIKKRMDDIHHCKEQLQDSQSAAIELFQNHTNEIFQIVGPHVVNFAKQEEECQDVINKANQKIRDLIAERAAAIAKVEKYHNLVHVQSIIVNGAQEAMAQTQERQTLLNSLIQDGEKSINKIPNTHTILGVFTYNNHDKSAQVAYYTGIINARNQRLKQQLETAGEARNILQVQQKELAEYSEQLKQAQRELNDMAGRVADELAKEDAVIKYQREKIEKIRKQADETENMVGMRGSVLVNCLGAMRNVSKAEKDQNCLYEPLVSVLDMILVSCESSVKMLDGDGINVFVGGVNLLKNVSFLNETAIKLRTVTSKSESRQQLDTAFNERPMITSA